MHVLIVGVAGITGRLLAKTLLTTPEITRVTGLDPRPCLPPVKGLHFVRARFRQPEWTPILNDVDAVIHVMGAAWPSGRSAARRTSSDATLFADTRFVIDAAVAADVHKLIVVTSAALYGQTSPPVPLSACGEGETSQVLEWQINESAPVRGHEANVYARARARVSDYLDVIAAGYSGVLTRLRVARICGARHTALARYARMEPVLVRGYEDRALDVIHEKDMIAAVLLALREDLPGAYNVCADEPITFRELATLAGQERDPMSLARVTLRAWWRWRWQRKATPPGWVRDLYRAGLLDAQKLRAMGWQPQYTAYEAVREAVEAVNAGG